MLGALLLEVIKTADEGVVASDGTSDPWDSSAWGVPGPLLGGAGLFMVSTAFFVAMRWMIGEGTSAHTPESPGSV